MKKNKHKLLITFIVLVQCLGYSQHNYFPYREGNLWGFCDESAQIILQPTFTNIERSIYEKGYYEISNGEKKGLFYNSKIIIPAEYENIKIYRKGIIITENKENGATVFKVFNADGSLLIQNKFRFIGLMEGYNYSYSNFIKGFYLKDINNKHSYVSVDFYNQNKINYLIENVYSLEIDQTKSNFRVDVVKIKKTEKSNEELVFIKKEEDAISVLDENAKQNFLKKQSSNDYEPHTDVAEDVPFEVLNIVTHNYIINQNGIEINYKKQRAPKSKQNQKIVDFPFKANFQTVTLTNGFTEQKINDTINRYSNIIVFKQKKKTGFFFKYPFEKGNLYDSLQIMKSIKNYDTESNYIKVGIFNKKTKKMNFGVVNLYQNEIIPIEFDDIVLGYHFNYYGFKREKAFLVKKDNFYGLINDKKEQLLPVVYDYISDTNKNDDFLLVKKSNQYGALVNYYNGKKYNAELLPTFFDYKIKEIVLKSTLQKIYPENVVQAIDYIILEDQNGNFKGYANPNGTLYFKD